MNKKTIMGTAIALTLLVSGTALAANYSSPADIISDLTKSTSDKVYEQRVEGKSYGEIAADNGVLDEFKNEMVKYKSSVIDERVAEGTLTKEEADAFKKELAERVADCDGTPDPNRERLGQKFGGGMGFAKDNDQGLGNGYGRMNSGRMGAGRGFNK
ncbi:hypothetical protein GOM49_01790 [Clostridium bovifaecis]|uniref:DUF2680 domain-containing protein n=1 Tax=Clostridium bovifaecis TaxID=2184719 RepID=A0A6I6F8G9_9CLOT|nr:hypothetical protein GOM49_01790 [Clostridium bovifaecis]